jgi:hypothetical protein
VYSTGYSFQILIKLEFSRQIFEKFSDIKFHDNLSCERRVVSCGRTDRQIDEANSHFSQFLRTRLDICPGQYSSSEFPVMVPYASLIPQPLVQPMS